MADFRLLVHFAGDKDNLTYADFEAESLDEAIVIADQQMQSRVLVFHSKRDKSVTKIVTAHVVRYTVSTTTGNSASELRL